MKTFSEFILESIDPKGPIKKYMSLEEIAKKHKISLDSLDSQLKMGIKIESEHTGSKRMAKIIALQHLEELPDYYSRLKKAEKIKEEIAPAKKEHKKFKDVKEALDGKTPRDPGYSLEDWFKGWVQTGGKYDGKPCARQPGQTTKPYCRDADVRASMSKEERNERSAKKRREDPNPNRSGAAKIVTQEEHIQEKKGEKDACYHKVKSRYKIWPSAYASGALVKCRKVGAKNWGNKTEETTYDSLPDWEGHIYGGEQRYCPKCQKMEYAEECKYGPKFWFLYSSAIEPSDQIRNNLSQLGSMKKVNEAYTRIQSNGSTYSILLLWKGKYLGIQIFFAQLNPPTKKQVSSEIEKVYPGSRLVSFRPSLKDPTKPLLFAGESNESRSNCS